MSNKDNIMTAESQNVIQANGLLSTEQAAEYLGRPLHSFRRYISPQIIPAMKYGKTNYYRKEQLDKWFADQLSDNNDSANIPQEIENAN